MIKNNTQVNTIFETANNDENVIITGIVNASGVAGITDENGKHFIFTLHCWRVADQQLQFNPLLARKEVNESELTKLMDLINKEDIVKFEAKFTNNFNGKQTVEFIEFLEKVNDDSELNQALRDYQKPLKILDPILGEFTLDKRINAFETKINWSGGVVNLSIDVDSQAQSISKNDIEIAYQLVHNNQSWHEQALDQVVKDLLQLKNEDWLAEDEKEISNEEFKSRLTLETISITDDRFTFWFEDGDLFWGHIISVSGTLDGGFSDADLGG